MPRIPTTSPQAGGAEGAGAPPAPTLRELLARNLPAIESYVRRRMPKRLRDKESAADVVDSVCGDLLGNESCFVYRGEREFRRWLQTVVTNKMRARVRYHARQKRGNEQVVPVSDSQLQAAASHRQTPSQFAMLRERHELIERALHQLPAHYREVIVRTRIHDESYVSVASSMRRTVPALRNLLNRALVQLASAMDQLQHCGEGRGAAGSGRDRPPMAH